MDLLSNLLSLLKIESTSVARWQLSAPWGVAVRDFAPGYCLTVIEGCCLVVAEDTQPIELHAGDTVLAPKGADCLLVSEIGAPITSLDELPWQGAEVQQTGNRDLPSGARRLNWGGGGTPTQMLGMAFTLQQSRSDFLLTRFPAQIVIRHRDTELLPAISSAMEALNKDDNPGFDAVASQLAEFLIISLIRSFILSGKADRVGWVKGLQDSHIRRALEAIHRAPEQVWTVSAMAQTALLSRSAFAARFHQLVGTPPKEYLGQLRAQLAADQLVETTDPIALIAQRLGFQSDRAFRRAFRQLMQLSPQEYRRHYHPK